MASIFYMLLKDHMELTLFHKKYVTIELKKVMVICLLICILGEYLWGS